MGRGKDANRSSAHSTQILYGQVMPRRSNSDSAPQENAPTVEECEAELDMLLTELGRAPNFPGLPRKGTQRLAQSLIRRRGVVQAGAEISVTVGGPYEHLKRLEKDTEITIGKAYPAEVSHGGQYVPPWIAWRDHQSGDSLRTDLINVLKLYIR